MVMCRLIETIPVARSVGTTISITKLFSNLPVRRSEFVKNIKKQYNKLLSILQAYAVISTNVRFRVVNSNGNKVGTNKKRR